MPQIFSEFAHDTLSYKALTTRDAHHTIAHVIGSSRVMRGSLMPKYDTKTSQCFMYASTVRSAPTPPPSVMFVYMLSREGPRTNLPML